MPNVERVGFLSLHGGSIPTRACNAIRTDRTVILQGCFKSKERLGRVNSLREMERARRARMPPPRDDALDRAENGI